MLQGKTVVLGITGGIAAYKAVDIASKLTQAGARVEVIMTESATKFITPLTLRNITGRPVVTDMFELSSEFSVEHVALAEAANVVLIAPATADIIAKIAAGIADESLTTTVLATRAPVVLVPSMNDNMYTNPITQENLAKLKARGFIVVEPGYGRLASGKIGVGRLPDIETIIGTVKQVLGRQGDLAGKTIVVTAGGTQEPVDPVRVITNRSSGKMGYALAEVARDRGAKVRLVAAPTALPDPIGIETVHVQTAEEMKAAVDKAVSGADALIMAAAVADYRAKAPAKSKIKKTAGNLTLELVKTPDILAEVKGEFVRVGFAAESENLVENARTKLQKKNLDLIVANDVGTATPPFGSENNKVTIITRDGKVEDLPLMTKREVAERVLERVEVFLKNQNLTIEIEIGKTYAQEMYFRIPQKYRNMFPKPGISFVLVANGLEEITTNLDEQGNVGRSLKPWFRKNNIQVGDSLVIKALRDNKYHLGVLRKNLKNPP